MRVKDCIGLTMRVLGYILDNNPQYRVNLCEIINKDNFNCGYLGIDEKGFYIEEHKQFNGSFAYLDDDYSDELDSYRLHISPYYVVRLLFESEKSFQMLDMNYAVAEEYVPTSNYSMRFGISYTMRNLDVTEQTLFEYISSYRKIASLISEIREGSDNGEKYMLSYTNLMKELDKIVVREPNSLAARIKSMKNMSYDDIACLRLRKPELARTIAVLDQIEAHLESASRYIYIDRVVGENNGDSSIVDEISENLDKETILNERVNSWHDFTRWVYEENRAAIIDQNIRYSTHFDRFKLTTFGLDVVSVPGNPHELKVNSR